LRAEASSLLEACDLGFNLLTQPAAIAYSSLFREPTLAPRALLGGRYRIVREIGRGGMATVYLADDLKHGRRVAVKTVRADIARMLGRERFAREIEIAARLSHPHILPLHDSGEETTERSNGTSVIYFVSPYATGESLGDRLRREPRFSLHDVVRIGREIAVALDYVHRQGVVHLDIKPENILLQEGHAVIADFGVARSISSTVNDTRGIDPAMPVLGTPTYMSPEQAVGLPDIDGRSDVYSLGCVLHELIIGERRLSGGTATAMDIRGRIGAAPDRAALRRRVSRDVAAVVVRAMAASREDRFATAGDLARALSDAARETKRGFWRRTHMIVVGAAVLVLSLVAFWM
jgi:serine/threonine-protein kinase